MSQQPPVEGVTTAIDKAELVALTRALIRARGENPGGTEQQTVDVLADACRQRGMEVAVTEVSPGRPNLVATLWPERNGHEPSRGADADHPSEAPPNGLLFLGHSDVVPAGGGWRVDPFEAVVEDDRIIGRGSTDMKGGLAAILVAIDAVRASGAALAGPVTLACTVDEEDLGLGVRALVESISPQSIRGHNDPANYDGLDPTAYAGCIVAEPTDLEVVRGCRGDAYFELHVSGVPAHSGRPADGRNAIDAMSKVITLIGEDHQRLTGAPTELLGSGTWSVGRIEGGTGTSIVAAEAHLWADRRLMPGEDPEQVLAAFLHRVEAAQVATDGITVTGEVTMQMPGFATAADHPLVRSAVTTGQALGLEAPVTGWTAACDGGFVDRDLNIPTIVLGPGSINDEAHQVNESVAVADLVRAAEWYGALITAVCTMVDKEQNRVGDVFS